MPKFKHTHEILKLMNKKEIIRNVGIIAHIDHGKTTLTDSFLAEAGLIPPPTAGKAKVLDYLEEEQKRGITIKTANISFLYKPNGTSYIINLIDTPGHVDFTGKVARALRAIDGAIVVVDAVEEVMAQTETVTRQALQERVRPALFINKVDRLIKELRLDSREIQNKFIRIIHDFNTLIEIYGEPEFKDKWKVSPESETVAFGSALHRWGFTLSMMKSKDIKFEEIVETYEKNSYEELQKILPINDAVNQMIVKNIPNPKEAQKYRIPKIWRGDLQSEVGKAMLNCDENGPATMCVTTTLMDPSEGLVAIGRLFSGSIKAGENIYAINAEKECEVKQVALCMGAFRENVPKISAGNICALRGVDVARAGETLVAVPYKNMMRPFEHVRYVSEPVMTMAVEPKNPTDLPRLIEAMNRLSIEDPNLTITINKETGECLLNGIGELQLEIALKFLKDYAEEIDVTYSPPMVVYRESISQKGKIAFSQSPNGYNKFWVQVEPLEPEDAAIIAENVWAVDENKNIFINMAGKSRCLEEERDKIISGFRWACKSGPLCGEPLKEVKAKLLKAELHENQIYRGSTQVIPAIRQAIQQSFLTAKPTLLEPVYRVEIAVPPKWVGQCINIVTRRRGKIKSVENKGVATIIVGYIPAAETFGLTAELHSATSGHAFCQSVLHEWQRTPENLTQEIVRQIRKRKGLSQEA